MINLLTDVVDGGTGKRAFLRGYEVAGKTGTAQKFDKTIGRYSSSKVVGSFAGFVPAHDPRLAMLVVIDEPQTNKWGGVVAAPVFRKVAERVSAAVARAARESGVARRVPKVTPG